MKFDKMNIRAVCLVMTCGCNLQCKYCQLAKKNYSKTSKLLQEGTIEALKSGEYLKNTLAVFEKFEQDPLNVTSFSFWGQEPTLTLRYITEHLEDWQAAFPNVNDLFFSTNGMDFNEDIIEFVKKLDSVVTVDEFSLGIQFSYDGEWSTNLMRGGVADTIKKHAFETWDAISKLDLKHLKLHFGLHAVVSMELLYYLDTTDKILAYEDEWRTLYLKGEALVKGHKNLSFGIASGIEIPYPASAADGKYLYKFFKNYIDNPVYSHNDRVSPLEAMLHAMLYDAHNTKFEGRFDDPAGFLVDSLADEDLKQAFNHSLFYCGANLGEFKIMYDGTLLNCQDFMFDVNQETIDAIEDKSEKSIRQNLLDHKLHFNPLKLTDDEIKQALYIYFNAKEGSYFYLVHQCATLLKMLSQVGQVDEKYATDNDALMNHALMLSAKNICPYNMLISTGSYFMKDTGYLRFYCNGFIDLIHETYKRISNEEAEIKKYKELNRGHR